MYKSDKTKLLDLLIKACWEIQLEPGASSNDRKKKKNEAWRADGGYHHLMKYFTHILFDAVFVPEGQMMESVTLCDCKEMRGASYDCWVLQSQLISDIMDKIITACQSQTQGPGNTEPSAQSAASGPAS